MKNLTSFKLSLLIYLLIFAIIFCTLSLLNNSEFSIFLISLLSSIVSFFFCWLVIEVFVFKKIRTIYKTIHDFRMQSSIETQNFLSLSNKNILHNLHQEIIFLSQEREEEIERLEQLEKYRKEYLGNVSHELKTPIFNIQGYVSTLLDGGLEDKMINRDYLQRAEKSVDRMISIIDDLEAITQLETKELQLEWEKFDIVPVIKEVLETQELFAKNKKINLLFMHLSAKPIFVFADKFRIRQVLTNLIVNSIRYGKEQGETRIKLYDVEENISIEVADNGIGIAKQHLSRIFERFYRVDKSRSSKQGGTGLGLAIVKHILEAHQQTINVISTEDVGSVFSFMLKKVV